MLDLLVQHLLVIRLAVLLVLGDVGLDIAPDRSYLYIRELGVVHTGLLLGRGGVLTWVLTPSGRL